MNGEEAQFAALTDVGRQRDHNEDNFLVDKKLGLFVVCDGMGGHAAGEVASALAVRTVHEELKREADLIKDYVEGKTGGAKVSKRDITNMLEFAVNRASSRVHAEAVKDEKKRGMGTTLAALLLVGSEAFIVWVGDSRIYHLRGAQITQVTEDHNVYNELIKRKKMTRDQADKVSQKNAITRAVGVYEHVEPEALVVDVVGGDRFLLCSDGLSGYFEDDLERLGHHLRTPDAEQAARRLIERANEQGGKDNITAVIVTVGDLSAKDEQRAEQLKLRRDTLARMPLFRPLNERELLRVLEVTKVVAYPEGATVIQQGEKGEEVFIVLSGRLKVVRNGAELAAFEAGDHFGEMALVRSQPRSATVVAAAPSELMSIRRLDFFEILRKEHQLAVKLLWQFLGVLADRLEETSRELGAAKSELLAEDVTGAIFDDDDEEENRTTLLLPPPPSLRGHG
jgi:serine/threonine protein phosphatase PrpC/CRP-like cAMP-binding protein